MTTQSESEVTGEQLGDIELHIDVKKTADFSPAQEVKQKEWYDYLRFGISMILVGGAFICVCLGILDGQSNFYGDVPTVIQLLFLFMLLFALGMMEGIQICVVELKIPDPEAFRVNYPRAYAVHKLCEGNGVDRFLIGRQISVVMLVFFAALLTSFIEPTIPFTKTPVPKWFTYVFLQSGVLGALVVVSIAQLTPQLLSSRNPIQFFDLPGMYYWVKFCMILEASGISHVSWMFVWGLEKCFGWEGTTTAAADADDKMPESWPQLKESDRKGLLEVLKPALKDLEPLHAGKMNTYMKKQTTLRRRESKDEQKQVEYFPDIFASGRSFKSPAVYRQEFADNNVAVPPFLLHPDDPKHIPPHVVVLQLLNKLHDVKMTVNAL